MPLPIYGGEGAYLSGEVALAYNAPGTGQAESVFYQGNS